MLLKSTKLITVHLTSLAAKTIQLQSLSVYNISPGYGNLSGYKRSDSIYSNNNDMSLQNMPR